MFQRFVVAFDGSEEARAAVRLAFALAERNGTEVTLAHVVEVPERDPDAPAWNGVEQAIQLAQEDWRGQLADVAGGAPQCVAVSTEVLVGKKAATALLDLLGTVGADLLVAGTHGVGGIKRTLLGSVSQRLLEHAPCSVLLARLAPELKGERVVVAGIDGSEYDRAVVMAAQGAAAALSAQLVLAHVVDERLPFASLDATHELRAWVREQGARVLREARQSVTAPLESVVEDLRVGRPVWELVALCEERHPALVVVASRGSHGVKGLLLGSTARDLVNHAPSPVLILRTGTDDG